ncbi:MAG: tyrosine-type recombinase/integrase [Pleurocapsa minor HA4230-MV1]|jgi:integrase|nr:tyrosine-type recombinase/integrase [Pleurocapsa minor HA4230-MV1]
MSVLFDWNHEPNKWLIAQNVEAKKLLSNPLLQKDVWRTIEDLGLEVNRHNRNLTINFESIKQDWLKLLTKLYVLIRSQHKLSVDCIRQHLVYLKKFSYFLETQFVSNQNQINNHLFDEFEYHLKCSRLSLSYIQRHYVTLKSFFDLCRQEKWLEIDTYWFHGRCQRIKPNNNQIEYIPEEIWQQLDENIHYLPEPIQRMVLVIRGTGLRIGELLNLPFDCLRKRNNKWRLRFLTEKYQVNDELPICRELTAVIKEQQKYIKNQFKGEYKNLFSSHEIRNNGKYVPTPRVMNRNTFNNQLNKLATKYSICTKEGKIWKFRSHQFRKTVATIMTNAGVRDLIIQKYLRHRSPDMQNYYKHLLKQVIGDEYQELMKETKYVDSTGKIVAIHKPNNPITELMRRKMYQITTQYGECHRSVLKSPCQTVNACWRCEHWLTSSNDLDALKGDLQRVEVELKIAENVGMVRQQKGLVSDKQNLVIRIQGLETNQ